MAARAHASVTDPPHSHLFPTNGRAVPLKLKARQSPLQTLGHIRTSNRSQQPITAASPPTWKDPAFPIGSVRAPA